MPLVTSLDESESELVTNLSLLAFDFRVKCDSRSHVNASLAIFSLVEASLANLLTLSERSWVFNFLELQ